MNISSNFALKEIYDRSFERKFETLTIGGYAPPITLGVHVSKSSKVLDEESKSRTVEEAVVADTQYFGFNAAQIFTHGPKGRAAVKMDEEAVQVACVKHQLVLVTHSSYVSATFWNGESRHLIDQLQTCDSIGAIGLVLHLPAKLTATEIATRLLEFSRIRIVRNLHARILLENHPYKSSEFSFETPQKINSLCHAIKVYHVPESLWGLCIDTAHLWTSGEDLTTKEQMQDWLAKLQYSNKIKLVHLNGNFTDFNSGRDEHAIVFSKDDRIWGDYSNKTIESGVAALVKFCQKNRIPMIMEINRGTCEEIKTGIAKIRNLA